MEQFKRRKTFKRKNFVIQRDKLSSTPDFIRLIIAVTLSFWLKIYKLCTETRFEKWYHLPCCTIKNHSL